MTTIKRSEFVRSLKNKTLKTEDLEKPAVEGLDLVKADLNHDGFVVGDRETKELFKQIDRADHDGSPRSMSTRNGKVRAGLSVVSEAAGSPNPLMESLNQARNKQNLVGPVAGARAGAGDPANKTATFDRVVGKGRRGQRVDGRVTINGNTYKFRSGGGGYGNLPAGTYTVTPHRWSRRDKPTMQVDGVGYSFALSDKYDSRVKRTRTLLRIHPDGRSPGTIGCMGIVGDGNVQRRFVADMRAELDRNGGSFTLQVGG